jgi:23S rRNA (guanosine2251-2'-O)-methyltransferase
MLIYGRHPVVEALEQRKELEKVYLQVGLTGEMEKEVRKLCREAGVPLQYVPKEKLSKMVKGNHQGIIAAQKLIDYHLFEELLANTFEAGKTPLIVALDGVTDVRNLGAIARSAEVLGADGLLLPTKNSAAVNEEAIKASAGALNFFPVCKTTSLYASLEYAKMSGLKIYAADLRGKKSLHEVDWKEPAVLVMGAEDVGISGGVEKLVDEMFLIPQVGKLDSLNVSVATGIVLYEAIKQRIF